MAGLEYHIPSVFATNSFLVEKRSQKQIVARHLRRSDLLEAPSFRRDMFFYFCPQNVDLSTEIR